jgi:hypothetical protein
VLLRLLQLLLLLLFLPLPLLLLLFGLFQCHWQLGQACAASRTAPTLSALC